VQYRDEEGTILTKEVTTGFSDGINVEIVSGLAEGDVVLIEG
jgi:HlyD family secretion protein